jgi:DNA invertase Pin-like site-specific DNA recombinase
MSDRDALLPQRAVAYVRVSMTRQGMISPELQIGAISEHCKRRGYKIIEVLEDLDLSGRFWQNRQVDAAITMLENDLADVIVVWRWSRVARNRLDWAVAVDRVEGAGGRLESATEPFDVNTATGRFARGMLAEFAAFESDRMGDVWREVRARRARLGIPPTGQKQFGYTKVGDRYTIHRRRGPILADLYRRFIAGESFRSLAQWLNDRHYLTARPRGTKAAWAHFNLASMMDRGFAAGYIRAGGVLLPGAHKALITQAEWQAYLSRRELTRWHRCPRVAPSLLAGMLVCSCGTPMKPEFAAPPAKPKYRCRHHRVEGRNSTVGQDRLDPLVLQWLKHISQTPQAISECRAQAIDWSEQRWVAARTRARQLASSGSDEARSAYDVVLNIETQAAPIDPPRVAHALVEDWPLLDTDQRRGRLKTLVAGFIADNTYMTPVLEIHTTWGTQVRFSGYLPRATVSLGLVTMPPEPGFTTEPTASKQALLSVAEAANVAGVSRYQIGNWRRAGLLPTTVIHQTFFYDIADLRVFSRAPRRTSGVDRAWIRDHLKERHPSTEFAIASVGTTSD